jgi:hypothetical protein
VVFYRSSVFSSLKATDKINNTASFLYIRYFFLLIIHDLAPLNGMVGSAGVDFEKGISWAFSR